MSKGWISLHRSIQDCWLWRDEPFSKGHAWIDLLLLANHRDEKISIDGKPVMIVRGQFHTSINKLAERWMWDRKKVMRYLDVLESDSMIEQNRSSKGTTLTIVNYEVYQDCGTTDGTAVGTTDGTAVGTQTININNKNNVNKVFVPPTVEEVRAYCLERSNKVDPERFVDFYTSKNWFVGKNKMKDWKASVRTWERGSNTTTTKPSTKLAANRDYNFDDLEKEILAN